MLNVDSIAEEIVAREGGYVNDPDDPGGATNFGVTIHTMKALGLDLDNDGKVTSKDVNKLSRAQAVDIFKTHYFYHPKIDKLPKDLQATVFDMQVNSGSNAIRILQNVLNEFGEDLVIDGALGRFSIAAAHRVFDQAGGFLVDAYGIARRDYYYAIGDRRVASRKYARRRDGGKGGWITRAEEFISKKFRLSAEEHKARISRWA